MSIDYTEWFANAKAELQQVQQHRNELQQQLSLDDKQIAALTKTINALAPLVGEEPISPSDTESSGITDRIRSILKQSEEPLSPTQIRDLLENAGCDMKSYSNPLATIHTVLRRLVEGTEAKEMPLTLGGKKYKCFVGVGVVRPRGPVGRGRVVGLHVGVKRDHSE